MESFVVPPDWLLLLLDNIYLILVVFYKKVTNGLKSFLTYIKSISDHLAKIDIAIAKLTTLTEQHNERLLTLERKE